jgi:hypothetical protein
VSAAALNRLYNIKARANNTDDDDDDDDDDASCWDETVDCVMARERVIVCVLVFDLI